MRAAGGGAIINYSSISYMMGADGYLSYVAAKAGITGLTYGLARDPRARQHPGERDAARRGADRAPARALGDAGGARANSSTASA